jgi:hypothetical protein
MVSAAGKLRKRSCGIGPGSDRSPIGANLAARTTAAASCAEGTCGAMIPSAPASSVRAITSGDRLGTRTIGVTPTACAAMQIWPVASSEKLLCSMST